MALTCYTFLGKKKSSSCLWDNRSVGTEHAVWRSQGSAGGDKVLMEMLSTWMLLTVWPHVLLFIASLDGFVADKISLAKNIREAKQSRSLCGHNNIHRHQIKGTCVILLDVPCLTDPILKERSKKHHLDPEEVKRTLHSQESGPTVSRDPQGEVIL